MSILQTRTFPFKLKIDAGTNTKLTDSIRLLKPMVFKNGTRRTAQLIYGSISRFIPNISTALGNRTISVSIDGFTTSTTITLDEGIYDSSDIQNAITSVLSSYYTDVYDPAIKISDNSVVQKVYITLDSSKLSSGTQVGIDLSQSNIYSLLGYDVGDAVFSTDGIHEAPNIANYDVYGNTLEINITEGLGNFVSTDNDEDNTIAFIDLNITSDSNTYTLNKLQTVECEFTSINEIRKLTFNITDIDKNILYANDGSVILQLQITEYA